MLHVFTCVHVSLLETLTVRCHRHKQMCKLVQLTLNQVKLSEKQKGNLSSWEAESKDSIKLNQISAVRMYYKEFLEKTNFS